jgi:hypothetical protein
MMWRLVKTKVLTAWGWGKLKCESLQWFTMPRESTSEVVVLSLLGRGSDGKVFLVANAHGEVGALKLLEVNEAKGKDMAHARECADGEAALWQTIYKDKTKWNVRSELWAGRPCVMMPRLNQFVTRDERLANVELVGACLEEFFSAKGYVHGDVAWRNVGYYKEDGVVRVVMLDLAPARVKLRAESVKPASWVEDAVNELRDRAMW